MLKEKYVITIILLTVTPVFSYCLSPERTYPYSPEAFQLSEYDTNFFTTPDGYKIISWDFKSMNEEKKIIIIAYGDSGNMSYCLYYVKQLVNSGYRVITFDYRGFGKSSDFKINNDNLYYNEFVTDLSTVLSETRKKYGTKKSIGLMAFSMGTIISTILSKNESFDFLVAENYVLDITETIKRLKHNANRNFLIPSEHDDYLKLIENIKCPMLLFSGTDDKITTISDSKTIVEIENNRKLITYKGGHGQGLLSLTNERHGDIYFSHVFKFLNSIP